MVSKALYRYPKFYTGTQSIINLGEETGQENKMEQFQPNKSEKFNQGKIVYHNRFVLLHHKDKDLNG